ncbi:hypothetical protein AYL99_01568 [Fonsecaea erecta]|uniref:Uncharacterized protein n=1 Tax=Fonsecaea erecta TaxID=1367422 RepID=A0A179A246_9EURO|nr:hypothetical protein AYL99_01568 [Fonsecaea erecta]OAP65596.1 hypothetical protein AYL99_01568 [Fonsecaea erecta]
MADLPKPEPNYTQECALRGPASQDLDDVVERVSHGCPEGEGSFLTLPAPGISAAHHIRSNKIFDRILFARSKGVRDPAKEEVHKRQQDERKAQSKARKEAATQERNARRAEEDRKRRGERQESKDRARQNNKLKAERKAQEKQVQDYYGIRGYDPSAGMLRSNRERVALRATNGQIQTSQDIDKVLSLRPQASQTWGLEYGKPKEDHRHRHSPLRGGGDDHTHNGDNLEE